MVMIHGSAMTGTSAPAWGVVVHGSCAMTGTTSPTGWVVMDIATACTPTRAGRVVVNPFFAALRFFSHFLSCHCLLLTLCGLSLHLEEFCGFIEAFLLDGGSQAILLLVGIC